MTFIILSQVRLIFRLIFCTSLIPILIYFPCVDQIMFQTMQSDVCISHYFLVNERLCDNVSNGNNHPGPSTPEGSASSNVSNSTSTTSTNASHGPSNANV